jgi:hypothetical protein
MYPLDPVSRMSDVFGSAAGFAVIRVVTGVLELFISELLL